MEPAPSQLVAIRKDRKFARAIFGAGTTGRKHSPWRSDRGDLAYDIKDSRRIGWTLLYIETCQLHPRKP